VFEADFDNEGARRKIDDYGASAAPKLLRVPLAAARMAGSEGLMRTAAHVRAIALWRAARLLERGRALPEARPAAGEPVPVRALSELEARAAMNCAPVPPVTLRWALRGLGLDLRERHFVDVGSGCGHALSVAAEFSFPRLTGVEFAQLFHDQAAANLAGLVQRGELAAGRVTLRHESALAAELPPEPLVVHLFHPFGATVMRGFVDRLDASFRARPRPIAVVYVNPQADEAFARPWIEERPLGARARAVLGLLSPFRVRAFHWTGPPSGG
jgi:hypothetical protein